MDVLSAGIQRRIALARGPFKWLFRQEFKRLVRYEHLIFDYFENQTIISDQDRKKINHQERQKIQVIPNGVSEQFLDFDTSHVEKLYDIAFVGNLSYAPNIEAAKYIALEILPALEKMGIQPKVLISGAKPSAELLSLKDRVELTGWVEDIRVSYASAKVFVAPMFIGTGLQNKLLEALALGLPCITTPLAFHALDCDADFIATAETPEEFAQEIARVLEHHDTPDDKKRRQNYVQDKFNWKKINAKLNAILSA